MKHISPLWKRFLLLVGMAALTANACADVIMHAFDWRYDRVTSNADAIKNAGYKAVLVVPPIKTDSSNCAWWQHYQPQDYRVIDHCRGNKEQFKTMIDTLAARGIAVYADAVLNQMANERGNATDFPGSAALSTYASNSSYWNAQKLFGDLSVGLFSSWDFHDAFCITNWTDTYQSTHGRICGGSGDRGMPDLKDTDSSNTYVNDRRVDYLRALKGLGVKGFRIDAAKHMPYSSISSFFQSDIRSGAFIFAEIITGGGTGNSDYETFMKPYLSQLPAQFRAYDFPLLNTIKNAFAMSGSMTALAQPLSNGQALEGLRAVTVPVTHDIPYNSGFRYLILDATDEKLAYAYLLGREDGVPMVFDDGSDGRTDNARWVGQYNASHIVAGIKFHERVLGQAYEVLASNDCALLFRRGKEGVAGINKCGYTVDFNVNTNEKFYWYRNYRDTLSNGNIVNISSSYYQFSLPGRTARMWLPD
ncbi:alpha-amylase family glycosyl hydrolase [Uliginosibacterium gangwonense]|uniref:alpha-amylase family glycosyl hydrolase n=1 Tax=Uliginosibacterium gangwonense TaxID=392736 RepID=UPI00037F03F2|nr:alpha-amylase family glycosyl hydrolase [Uliginosibacterium gangwonense]